MTISEVTKELLCSGCGTCNAVCAHNAITMEKSPGMGLLYATVDENKCVDCGLCYKMCPSKRLINCNQRNYTTEDIVGHIEACYVGRSLNEDIYRNAQSGGMVTAILTHLFDNGLIDAAVTCKMEYGHPTPSIHYNIVEESAQLRQTQKSCYTQVDIVSALKFANKYSRIAVVGLPCHLEGISNLEVLKQYHNIKYKIGLICEQSYSDAYMDAIVWGEKMSKDDIYITYKKKDFTHNKQYFSYQEAPIAITNRQGDISVQPKSKRLFLKDFFVVPKCRLCDNKLNITADIVLGDPWGLKGLYDERKGDSVILVRTVRANSILESMFQLNEIRLTKVELDRIIQGQLVRERIDAIGNCNWSHVKEQWMEYETKGRDAIVSLSCREYQHKVNRDRIIRIKQRIKLAFSKLLAK